MTSRCHTQEQAYQLLARHWAHADKAALRAPARRLVAAQRPDGGWSQIPTLASDAYATGQVLVALLESGACSPADAGFPCEKDQFISVAATNLAAQALLYALPKSGT